MAEQLHHGIEHQTELDNQPETSPQLAEVSVEQEQRQQQAALEQAEKRVAEVASSKDEIQVENGNHRNEQPLFVNHELKKMALDRTLARVRRQLSTPDKLLSKAIHQPIVQVISETGSKTIARPSGILMGSLCALLGSSFVFYLAKHYGFRYNYLLFFGLFLGGFMVGLIIELIIWFFRHRRVEL